VNQPDGDPRPRATSGHRVVLRLSDGREVPLRGMTLLGRNPRPDADEVVTDLVTLTDPRLSVSKTHLLVGMDAAGPFVVDRHSTNGTMVTLPDGQQILCGPGQTVRVPPGAVVTFGDFTLVPEHDGQG
jgi:pSer/pThr/pTyr-binding forkhead associated (FHA) protein